MRHFVDAVAGRAATIDELLAIPNNAVVAEKSPDVAERRLAAWCAASAGNDWTLFDQRLSRDGLDRAQVLRKLGTCAGNADRASWLETAVWISDALSEGPSTDFSPAWQDSANQLAFGELFFGVIERAECILRRSVAAGVMNLVSGEAATALALELCRDLSCLAAPALYERLRRGPAHDHIRADDPANRLSYCAFVATMRRDGFRALFLERPVLLRLLAIKTQQWIGSTAQFLDRLFADQAAIRDLTFGDLPKRIEEAQIVGDLHNHGRAVRRVIFSDGAKVFYKPKDLSIDMAWSELIRDLNARGPPEQLRAPKALARDGYGWTEAVGHTACNRSDEFAVFFQKAGAWLCLFNLFSAMDMHEQNIVACGDDPVPVDLETLLQPSQVPAVSETDPRHAYTMAGGAIACSVLSTGLLPGYGRLEGQRGVVEHGGFLETRSRERVVEWLDVNTDRMRPVARWRSGKPMENRPYVGQVYPDIKDHVDDVVSGYERYGRFVIRVIESAGVELLVDRFRHVRVRKLIKNTRFYSLLLERLRDERNMADGPTWSAHLDFVCRFADWNAERDPWWPLLAAERASLAELNIPYFMMAADDARIFDADGRSADSGLRPGLEQIRKTLLNFNDEEICRQAKVVRLSLSSVRHVGDSLELRKLRRSRSEASKTPVANIAVLRARANGIADELARLAFRGQNSAAWLSLDWLEDSTICQLAPLGANLYNGTVGVGVFFAAHAHLDASAQSANLAQASVAALRSDLLGASAARSARALGIGGSTGLGSIIYGLTIIAELIRDKSLLADALRISRLIDEELVTANPELDLMDGLAGALLGLLKLYRVTREEETLVRAKKLGDQLLRRDGAALMKSGLSHGPAGVAYALTALAAATRGAEDLKLILSAEKWLGVENATFCHAHQTWPDARSDRPHEDSFWPCQWCHGAAGIGLARIAIARCLRVLPEPRAPFREFVEEDMLKAVEATKAAWPYATDSLCCGSLGGIEFLAEAGRYLERPDLQRLALTRMFETVAEADREGDYLWDIGDRSVNIGLFRGISGVGYTLLRQLSPSLPNILALG